MKKILIILVAIASLHAADNDLYDNAIALTMGYDGIGAYSGWGYGLRVDRNLNTSEGTFNLDAMQLAVDYVRLGTAQREYAVRVGANALWFIENDEEWMPFVKIGTGVQFFDGTEKIAAGNYFFGTLGGGIEYQMRPDTSLVAEVVDHYSFAGENSLRAAVSLKYSFGQSY